MFIKQVVLDGFKSYATRTDIGPFDPHFNAITGLNGSGKSNILDAICFALGLSSLTVVRAGNLQDLINKGSNCTRATASIIIDNSDKSTSPIGYEKYDTIVVSRTVEQGSVCKYYLNSVTSTKKAIIDLFESVHISLTMSTPNFMIMQGKITKVINMRPKEILHMIEEAVGAAVYQQKRDRAQRDLDEKEKTIKSVNNTMKELVYPSLEKQRAAQARVKQYNEIKNEMDKRKSVFAIKFYIEVYKSYLNAKKEMAVYEKKNAEEEKIKVSLEQDRVNIDKRLEEIKEESNKLMQNKLSSIEKEMDVLKKKRTEKEANVESAKTNLKTVEKKVKLAEDNYKKEQKIIEDYKKSSGKQLSELTSVEDDIRGAQENLDLAKKAEEDLNMGKIESDGVAVNLQDELIRIQDEIAQIEPRYESEDFDINKEKKILKEKQTKLSKTPKNADIERDINKVSKLVQNYEKELKTKNVDPQEASGIEVRIHENRTNLNQIKQRQEALYQTNSRLLFKYRDPTPNFNRNSVFGQIYELFDFNNDEYKGAFEVLASSYLCQVVVDNDNTGKLLIQKGDLAYRTTIHAISKYQSSKCATQRQLDQSIGRGKAIPAIDTMSFDPKFKNLFENLFGYAVFCDNIETAKRVAFELNYKAITKEGDVVQSDGIMQGGTRRGLGELLNKCIELRELALRRRELEGELNNLNDRLRICSQNKKLIEDFEQAKRDLENAEKLRGLTEEATLTKEIKQIEESLKRRSELIKELSTQLNDWKKQENGISKKIENIDTIKKKQSKDIQSRLNQWKKALDVAQNKYNSKKSHFDEIKLDYDSKMEMLNTYLQDIENEKKALELEEKEYNLKNDEFLKATEQLNELQEQYKREREMLTLKNTEKDKLENKLQQIAKNINDIEIEKIKRENGHSTVISSIETKVVSMNGLKEEYPDIDFENLDINMPPEPNKTAEHIKRELVSKQKKLDELHLLLDFRAAEMVDTTESSIRIAYKKLKRIENNRVKLGSSIKELDDHKIKIVKAAYDQVNQDFCTMMGTLLPGAQAKLVPVKADNLAEGLLIHVCLGGVWKESLTELSGGQRSLVALALVLSLCMYNSAPFYILDEIDAALDLSHTQNIGCLIKNKFKNTQFICVSLKDGMYSNANVLFQVSFVNGRSQVKRNVRRPGGQRPSIDEDENSNGKQKPKKIKR